MTAGRLRWIAVVSLLALGALRVDRPVLAQGGPYTWRNVAIDGGGFRPRHRLQPDRAEPGLRPHRHRRRVPLEPATSRWIPLLDWVGWDHWG